MIGPLLVGVLTQCFGVRVGFLCCGDVATRRTDIASSVWTRKVTDV